MKDKNSLYINVTITEYILLNLKYRADWQIYQNGKKNKNHLIRKYSGIQRKCPSYIVCQITTLP